jgi:hypothetical protein
MSEGASVSGGRGKIAGEKENEGGSGNPEGPTTLAAEGGSIDAARKRAQILGPDTFCGGLETLP